MVKNKLTPMNCVYNIGNFFRYFWSIICVFKFFLIFWHFFFKKEVGIWRKKIKNVACIILVNKSQHFIDVFLGDKVQKFWVDGLFAGIFVFFFSKIHQVTKQKNQKFAWKSLLDYQAKKPYKCEKWADVIGAI